MDEFEIGDIVTVRYEQSTLDDPIGEWEVAGPSNDSMWPIKLRKVGDYYNTDIVNHREIFLVTPRDGSEFEYDV